MALHMKSATHMFRTLILCCLSFFCSGVVSAQFFQGSPANCSEGQLYIKENDLREDLHITAFSFELEQGSFMGIARFPESWDLDVQHSSYGTVRIEAHSRSATGSVRTRLFEDIAVYVHGVCDEQMHLAVHGVITVLEPSGSSRDLPFSAYSFLLSDAPVRRRLAVH
jgi:hypothetical protein